MLMLMNLRKLQHATVLANEGNYKKAALKLCITQPALSRSITKLEEELGFQLFDRNQTSVTLTTLGKGFIQRAQKLLQHAYDIDYDMTLMRKGMGGNVAFGMGPYPATALLRNVLKGILREKYEINIRVEVSSPEHLLSQLHSEEIEFFLANADRLNLSDRYISSPLINLKLSFFVRRDHPFLSSGHKDISDLLRYSFIGTVASSNQLLGLKRRLGIPATSEFQLLVACNDIHVLKSLALESDAILIAPFLALSEEYERGDLQQLELVGSLADLANACIEISIIRFADRALSPAADLAVKILREISENI